MARNLSYRAFRHIYMFGKGRREVETKSYAHIESWNRDLYKLCIQDGVLLKKTLGVASRRHPDGGARFQSGATFDTLDV